MPQEEKAFKKWLAQVFDSGSDQYGLVGPRFFDYFGNLLVEQVNLHEGATVLDIACGRGACLFPASERVGPSGRVVGIDLSPEMVANTTKEIEARGIHGLEVRQMDAEELHFPDDSFDFALCGFALFFFPNSNRSLTEIRRVLKSDGIFATTTFGQRDSRWKPFGKIVASYKDRLSPVPEIEETDFDNAEEIAQEFTNAGFDEVTTTSIEKEFHYSDADEWWATLWSHGMRAFLERLDKVSLQEFKSDCYQFAQELAGDQGIPQKFTVLISQAWSAE